MAVDTIQLQSIYTALSTSAKTTLDEQWNDQRLKGSDYANVVSQTITALLQTSAQLLEQQAQIDQDDPVKTAQADLIAKQKLTEVAKAALANRQESMYDDNLRVEEAKMLTNVVGMYGAGGTALPTGLETQMVNAINLVTP